jgi:hypothetical protein
MYYCDFPVRVSPSCPSSKQNALLVHLVHLRERVSPRLTDGLIDSLIHSSSISEDRASLQFEIKGMFRIQLKGNEDNLHTAILEMTNI